MRSRKFAFLLVTLTCMRSPPVLAQSSSDWVDIKDPNELRALYSNKTFRSDAWVGHYRADGKGILIVRGGKPQPRTWEVKDNDSVCVAAGSGPSNCYRYQRNSKKPSEFMAINVDTDTTLTFTVEDGVPTF